MMLNIGVIILNYLAYEATINCVQCFKEQSQEGINMKVIIVDNASDNQSYKILKETYEGDNQVKVVKTEKNLGFANGNNFGYEILKEDMKYDYIIISNDDILLKEKNLFQWIIACDKKYQFGVLGPCIYSIGGEFYQSPMKNYTNNSEECKKKLYSYYKELFKLYVKSILKKDYKTMVVHRWDNNMYDKESINLTLHGSFQIFSKKYFQHYNEPYDANTFLYMEEHILRLRCDKEALPMVYSPKYKIEHLQATSTNMMKKKNITKEIFRIKNQIKSLKIYIERLKAL